MPTASGVRAGAWWARLLVVALALVLLANGVAMTVAGLGRLQAAAFMDDWEKTGSAPGPRAWQIAVGAGERAVAWYPVDSADALERLGLLHAWQRADLPPGAPEARASRSQAVVLLRAATRVRPEAGTTWARLAWVKVALGEVDPEFEDALRQASERGPWRIQVNRELAQAGLLAWESLSSPAQAVVVEQVRRSVNYSKKEALPVMATAYLTGLAPMLCEHPGAGLPSGSHGCP